MFEFKDLVGFLDSKVTVTSVLLTASAVLGALWAVRRVYATVVGAVKAVLGQFPVTAVACVAMVLGGTASFGYGVGELLRNGPSGHGQVVVTHDDLTSMVRSENTKSENLKLALDYAASTKKPEPPKTESADNGHPAVTGVAIFLGLGLFACGVFTAIRHYG